MAAECTCKKTKNNLTQTVHVSLSDALVGTLATLVNKWGVQVEKVQVEDIRLLSQHLHNIVL